MDNKTLDEALKYLGTEPDSDEVMSYLISNRAYVNNTPGLAKLVEFYAKRAGESLYDFLTGVYNRRGFDHEMNKMLRVTMRTVGGTPLTLVSYDLDDFKAINDNHGHQAGDEALRIVAHVLKDAHQRASEAVGRIGGDEFIVAQQEHFQKAVETAEEVKATVSSQKIGDIYLKLSYGAAFWKPVYGDDPRKPVGMTAEDMLRMADERLYQAKNAKKVG